MKLYTEVFHKRKRKHKIHILQNLKYYYNNKLSTVILSFITVDAFDLIHISITHYIIDHNI